MALAPKPRLISSGHSVKSAFTRPCDRSSVRSARSDQASRGRMDQSQIVGYVARALGAVVVAAGIAGIARLAREALEPITTEQNHLDNVRRERASFFARWSGPVFAFIGVILMCCGCGRTVMWLSGLLIGWGSYASAELGVVAGFFGFFAIAHFFHKARVLALAVGDLRQQF